jgi:hypothetical protein
MTVQTGGARSRILPALVLAAVVAVSLGLLALLPPIPQDQDYHRFADERAWLGIPNFWNVVSNLPFIAIGAVGLWRCRDGVAARVLFVGVLLTGFGSSYYHWDPNDSSLFWDRLPMTIAFAAIVAIAVGDRLDQRMGAVLLWPMLALGLFSLLLWLRTDDLRLYFWVQFFPGLVVLLLFLFYPAKYTGTRYWIAAAALYALAKLFEFADAPIFAALGVVSGHTLKHLAAATACGALLLYFLRRRPIA